MISKHLTVALGAAWVNCSAFLLAGAPVHWQWVAVASGGFIGLVFSLGAPAQAGTAARLNSPGTNP